MNQQMTRRAIWKFILKRASLIEVMIVAQL